MFKQDPFLIICTSSGRINVIATPPLIYKYSVVYGFMNYDIDDVKKNDHTLSLCRKREEGIKKSSSFRYIFISLIDLLNT